MRFCIVRTQPYGFAKLCHHFFAVCSLTPQESTQDVVPLCVPRITGQIPGLAQRYSEESVAGASCGIEPNALPQLRDGFFLGVAVPQCNSEVVVRLRRFRLECHGTLQVNECGRDVALLTQNKSEDVMRPGVILIKPQGLGKLCLGCIQITASGSLLAAPVQ